MATLTITPGTNIQTAIGNLSNSDVLQFRQGTYTQTGLVTLSSSSCTLTSYPGERATIVGTTGERFRIFGTGNTVQYLNLHQTGSSGNSGEMEFGGDNHRLLYCDLTNNHGQPTQTHAIKCYIGEGGAGAENFLGQGNFWHHIGRGGYEGSNQNIFAHAYYIHNDAINCTFVNERGYRIMGGYMFHMYTDAGGHDFIRCCNADGYLLAYAGGAGDIADACASAWTQGSQTTPTAAGGANFTHPIRAVNGHRGVDGSTGIIRNSVHFTNAGTSIASGVTQSSNLNVNPQFRNPAGGDFTIDNAAAKTKLGYGGISTAGLQLPVGGTVPPKPSTPACSAGFDAQGSFIDVDWPAVSGATSYAIYSQVYGNPTVTRNTSTADLYRVRPVIAGKPYLVQVAGVNSTGEGVKSNYGSVLATGPPTLPAAPTGVTIAPSLQGSLSVLTVYWTPSITPPVIYFVFLNGSPVAFYHQSYIYHYLNATSGSFYTATVLAVSTVTGKASVMSAPSATVTAL